MIGTGPANAAVISFLEDPAGIGPIMVHHEFPVPEAEKVPSPSVGCVRVCWPSRSTVVVGGCPGLTGSTQETTTRLFLLYSF
jgi:hypothetical protein